METVPTLIIVPARAESAEELEPVLQTLVSLRGTAPTAMVLVIDDSPSQQAQLIAAAATELECAYAVQEDGDGRLDAYNNGLAVAAEHGMDVVLTDAGIVFDQPGWLDRLKDRTGTDGTTPAPMVGGAVIEPVGTIRSAGYFFSLFRRAWAARLSHVPEILLDQHTPLLCPVSLDLALIRHGWIDRVGLLDTGLDVPHASLDIGLRIFTEGGECIFEPTVRARSLETQDNAEPDEWSKASGRLRFKHAGMSFQRWAPEVI